MTNDEFEPFEALKKRAWSEPCQSWAEVEADFIATVGAFDREYSTGKRPPGWYQQKAKFFNDLVVRIIENCTGRKIATRAKKRSVLFSDIDIDICYPESGDPIVAAEVKALGTPPHPGNNGKARHARSDMHKRVREVAFTAMDIKAAHAKPRTISSFQAWVDTAEPAYLSFWALRVDGTADLSSVRSILASLKSYCNGVGAVIYEATTVPTKYAVRQFPEFNMDRAIRDFTQRVIST
ncbi:MAG: hypothetical protein JNK15_14060 [Planctomycetes bacterium]|nr:hypothetical protein [Planctomycetota bacterium]